MTIGIISDGRKSMKQTLLDALAEEDVQTLGLAYSYAQCLTKYGVDITKVLDTATANVDALGRAYRKGYHDAMERADRMRMHKEEEEMTAGIISKETAVNAAYDLRKYCNQQKSCAKCIFQIGDADYLKCSLDIEPKNWDLSERKEEMLREIYKDGNTTKMKGGD